tara:strand:+ start:40 stop:555 length:516 start_codon:yes stop_codon:yes gene_type:complete
MFGYKKRKETQVHYRNLITNIDHMFKELKSDSGLYETYHENKQLKVRMYIPPALQDTLYKQYMITATHTSLYASIGDDNFRYSNITMSLYYEEYDITGTLILKRINQFDINDTDLINLFHLDSNSMELSIDGVRYVHPRKAFIRDIPRIARQKAVAHKIMLEKDLEKIKSK